MILYNYRPRTDIKIAIAKVVVTQFPALKDDEGQGFVSNGSIIIQIASAITEKCLIVGGKLLLHSPKSTYRKSKTQLDNQGVEPCQFLLLVN